MGKEGDEKKKLVRQREGIVKKKKKQMGDAGNKRQENQ